MTETKTSSTGTILHQHGHATRLVAAIRSGAVIQHILLATYAPDYEGARAEAQTKFPGHAFYVPRLGETAP